MLKQIQFYIRPLYPLQQGASLLEVLITILILSFGLLGLAGLQSKNQQTLLESYQRAQAVLLLSDMAERMNANRAFMASYVSATSLGTGDTQPDNCNNFATIVAKDQCEWSRELKGSAELSGSGSTASKIGAVIGARGCITQIQAPDASAGVCRPGIYQISVAWQGVTQAAAPTASSCGNGQYGDETYRRVLTQQVSVGLLSC